MYCIYLKIFIVHCRYGNKIDKAFLVQNENNYKNANPTLDHEIAHKFFIFIYEYKNKVPESRSAEKYIMVMMILLLNGHMKLQKECYTFTLRI